MSREFDLGVCQAAHTPPRPWLIYPPEPWRSWVRGYIGHLLTVCKVFAYGVVGACTHLMYYHHQSEQVNDGSTMTAAYITDYMKCFRVVVFTPEHKLLTNLSVSEFLTTSTKLLNLGSYLKCGRHTCKHFEISYSQRAI